MSSQPARTIVGVGDGVGEGVAIGVGIAVGAEVGVDALFATIPLFQINFFPDLTHVNFRLETTRVLPTLVHLVPAMLAQVSGSGASTRPMNVPVINVLIARLLATG